MVIKLSTASAREHRRKANYRRARIYCTANIKKFFCETTLHGLKYLADSSITIWEKTYFFAAFIVAIVIVYNLTSQIYTKWSNTPVIIGTSPYPTSITQVPFPAITICNMNQVLASKVANYSDTSFERALLEFICFSDAEFEEPFLEETRIKNNRLRIDEFIIDHAQSCDRMLLSCKLGAHNYNCSDLFREVITDEGLCCVFNTLHPDLLFKGPYKIIKELTNLGGTPVTWSPETGYPSELPENFYPRPAGGSGASMGLTLILNAELDEYYCSSTNGPGFKVAMHNPVETANVKDTGLLVPVGYETRFRIDTVRSEAVPNIRSVQRRARQCVFRDELHLLYYKYYTRRNCENECQAKFMHERCRCIAYSLPRIFNNSTVCTIKDFMCSRQAQRLWLGSADALCRSHCLSSCFDLVFMPDSFSVPLAQGGYIIQSELLRNYSKAYMQNNLAIIHFYYRESVFHGDLKNVFIGFTDFLSNIGGIMGLFLGFSFISLVEMLYFAFLRPITEIIAKKRQKPKTRPQLLQASEAQLNTGKILLGKEQFWQKRYSFIPNYDYKNGPLVEYSN